MCWILLTTTYLKDQPHFMTNYSYPRQRRRPARQRKPRFKRPLVVLTYLEDRLTAIHSSTPAVQFVRLDVTPSATPDDENTDFPKTPAAKQLSVPLLSALPPEQHRAAQRAFRHS
jgi:hypothetical protein